jgi:hypothetical protein
MALLLEQIEALYKVTLALTEESEQEESDSDRQIAIEEKRKQALEKVDLLFEKATQEQIEEDHFLHQRERLLKLISHIRHIDKRRATLIKEEQASLALELQSLRLGKQAVIQYQKSIPTEI